jgi:diguanylate cyclase
MSQSRAANIRAAYDELVSSLHAGAESEVLAEAALVLLPAVDEIADNFYRELLEIEGTKPFLSHDLVQTRLKASLAGWLRDLLQSRDAEQTRTFIDHQLHVGTVHARVNIPPHLVNLGARILKREIFQRVLGAAVVPAAETAPLLILLNDIFDTATALINESYMGDVVNNERHAQALKMHAVSHHLAIECERMRSALLDWLRRILQPLYQDPTITLEQLPSIHQSDFGLWLIHKAELIFQDGQEIGSLKDQLARIDLAVRTAVPERSRGIGEEFGRALQDLNDAVTQATWLLSSLVDRTLEQEGGRDALTRLFNRRYLHTILQREVTLAAAYGLTFAVVLLDIDFFKKFNDTYGHDAGDAVLCQTAELLTAAVRAGDFVFRYGGEEFLVLLSDVTPQVASAIAEKLRTSIEGHAFALPSGKSVRTSASFGIALHDGHPDYQNIISRADVALYAAKESGRNRCVFAEATVPA